MSTVPGMQGSCWRPQFCTQEAGTWHIVFFLDASIGSAFERVEGEGLVEVDNGESPLH